MDVETRMRIHTAGTFRNIRVTAEPDAGLRLAPAAGMKDDKTTSPPPGADAGLVDLDKVRAGLEQDARDGEAVKRRIDALKAEIDRRQKPAPAK